MHELSITENILDIALKHARQENAEEITDIYIVIGQLTSYIDESIQFYWQIMSKDTIAENSNLHFKRILAEFKCQQCENTYHPDSNSFTCPYCQSTDLAIIAGREFFLESIEINK